MQLYALDQNLSVVYAKNASRHHSYKCLECQSLVRLRGGIHRQNHFYHVELGKFCRQNGKSMEHLQVQLFFQEQLTPHECQLEKRFTEINRIADVVWLPKKIIFEVQCSPILKEEIVQRNRDYENLGYTVIWVLHEKRFNKSHLQASRQYLQNHLHYYTNIDSDGKGIIYDQFHVFEKGRQIFNLPACQVNILNFKSRERAGNIKLKNELIPDNMLRKMESSALCFGGDLVDYCDSHFEAPDFFKDAMKIIHAKMPKNLTWKQKLKGWLSQFIVRPYKIVFRMLLEKACM
jgi:competence protein CoiA